MLRVAVLALLFVAASAGNLKMFGEEQIDIINNLHTTWKAGVNQRFIGVDEDYARALCGVLKGGYLDIKLPVKQITPLEDIPDTFDARTQWPNCPTIKEIRDQGACGSCWVSGSITPILNSLLPSPRVCMFKP